MIFSGSLPYIYIYTARCCTICYIKIRKYTAAMCFLHEIRFLNTFYESLWNESARQNARKRTRSIWYTRVVYDYVMHILPCLRLIYRSCWHWSLIWFPYYNIMLARFTSPKAYELGELLLSFSQQPQLYTTRACTAKINTTFSFLFSTRWPIRTSPSAASFF